MRYSVAEHSWFDGLAVVVPMAGAGERYRRVGFRLPKPLIPVGGAPMVVRAVRDLPEAERLVFLVRSEHIRNFGMADRLLSYFPSARVLEVEGLTEGQACTIALAEPALDPEQPVLVAACDNTHVYDRQELARRMVGTDCLVWTYRNDTKVLAKPTAHGWVETEADGSTIVRVSCKRPISDNPLGDHAVSGFFCFASARLMLEAIGELVARNIRVNGEFYADSIPNILLSRGSVCRVFEVDKYIGWGTPEDLRDYELWERHFGIR